MNRGVYLFFKIFFFTLVPQITLPLNINDRCLLLFCGWWLNSRPWNTPESYYQLPARSFYSLFLLRVEIYFLHFSTRGDALIFAGLYQPAWRDIQDFLSPYFSLPLPILPYVLASPSDPGPFLFINVRFYSKQQPFYFSSHIPLVYDFLWTTEYAFPFIVISAADVRH